MTIQADSIITLNCELCQSEFSVLSGRLIKNTFPLYICRPNDYTIEIIVLLQIQIYNILLMFFPLFSNVFTNILKIYELPKIYNKILKKLFTIIIYQVSYVTISSGFSILLKMYTWWQKTFSALN